MRGGAEVGGRVRSGAAEVGRKPSARTVGALIANLLTWVVGCCKRGEERSHNPFGRPLCISGATVA